MDSDDVAAEAHLRPSGTRLLAVGSPLQIGFTLIISAISGSDNNLHFFLNVVIGVSNL